MFLFVPFLSVSQDGPDPKQSNRCRTSTPRPPLCVRATGYQLPIPATTAHRTTTSTRCRLPPTALTSRLTGARQPLTRGRRLCKIFGVCALLLPCTCCRLLSPLTLPDIIASFVTTGKPETSLDWPPWASVAGHHTLVNLNQTGGTPYSVRSPTGAGNVTQYMDPGLRNQFGAEDADAWEGGRGARCAFWQTLGARIPE